MTTAIAKLSSLIDSEKIIPWENLDLYWRETVNRASISQDSPSCLIYPHTQDTLGKIIQCANENHWTILICGSGSKLGWGGLVKSPEIVLSTQHLNRIIEHAVGDLTITVEAGVKLADLQAFLLPYRQFLPIDPCYPDCATLGGVIATADTGTWRQRYGGVRDMVLGFSVVRADGKIAKAGGKVVKNVAGYDMMKLFTGSYGTLGIISQITLRLYPLPDASKTLIISGEIDKIAKINQMIRQSGLTPTAAEMLSPALVQNLNIGQGLGLLLRFQSIPESIIEQSQQVSQIVQQLGGKVNSYREQDEVYLWQQLQNCIANGDPETTIFCKIGVMPKEIVAVLQQFDDLTQSQGLGMMNISRGIGKFSLKQGELLEKMRVLCQTHQGFLTVLEAPKSIKEMIEPWGYTGNALEIMRKLKQKFDPNYILNPNKFVGNI